eukprot:GEMP01026941.1.p1 GENE.GEMP01026941.1~~GEMP01026941.1.p1  ORF type:complete len:483 (+),score=100.94 GEMP01026941.1:244-1692(+)
MLLSMCPFLFGLLTITHANSPRDASQTPRNSSTTDSTRLLTEERMGRPEWYDASVPSRVRRRLTERNGRVHFKSCWFQQDKGLVLVVKIGILVDNSYWRRLGAERLDPHLAKIVAYANRVFSDQMDVVLVIADKIIARVEMKSSTFAKQQWIYDQPDKNNKDRCGSSTDTLSMRMRKFGHWVDGLVDKHVAFWILFTGCSYVEGFLHTLGRAIIGGFCTKFSRHGVVTAKFGESPTATTTHSEHTFTHEVGHLLGALHTIQGDHPKWDTHIVEAGETVYGIMSYTRPYTWKNIYQFHPIHMENICSEINSATLTRIGHLPYEVCFSNTDCPGSCAGKLGNNICDEGCNIVACNFDGADCQPCKGCFPSMLGDGHCDEECNKKACRFDNQDCSCSANADVALKCAKNIDCFLDCGSKIGDQLTRFIPLAARNELPRFLANSLGYWFAGGLLFLLILALSSWCCCCKKPEPEKPVPAKRITRRL